MKEVSSLFKSFENVEKTNKAIKTLAADSLLLYIKVSDLHYLVQGSTFSDIHKITDDYYKFFQDVYDFLNERLLQLHQTPIRDSIEAIKFSSIEMKQSKKKYTTDEVSQELISYFNQYKEQVIKLKELAANSKDYVTEDYCIQKLYFLDKELWQLRSRLSSNFVM